LSDFVKVIFGIEGDEPIENGAIVVVVTFLIFLLFVFGSLAMER